MNNKLAVEIPKMYLLIIAAHGNMGDGELPDMMKIWAQKECERLGIMKDLKLMQSAHLRELGSRLRNTLGDELFGEMTKTIEETLKKIG